jgi:SNF2 family DNA or RNA helicase
MNVLLPKAFDNAKKFVDLIQLTESFVKGHYVDHSNSLAMIHNVLRPFILRRTHAVLDRSPSARMQQFVVPVDLSPQQRQMYNRIQSSKKIPMVQPDGSAKLKIIKNVFPELRKVCCHPDLIFKDLQSSSEHCIGKSPKFDLFLDMVLKLHNAGRKVLVLSTMIVFLRFASDILREKQIHHHLVTGSVAIDDRIRFASEFTTSENANIFLMGTRVSGGSRLDLKCTDAIIFYDCDWNASIDVQIQNRVYGIGQRSSLKVFYFVAVDTIEEHLFAAREWCLKSTSMSEAILAIDKSRSREDFSIPSIDRKSLLKNAVAGEGPRLDLKLKKNSYSESNQFANGLRVFFRQKL